MLSPSITLFHFTRAFAPPLLFLNNRSLPFTQLVRYLFTLIDRWLTWLPHIANENHLLNARLRFLRPLLTSNNVKPPIKLLFYKKKKKHLRPIWSYGVQLWISNTNCIQRFQSKVLCIISKAPFYVSNRSFNSDLKVSYVTKIAKLHYKSFDSRLYSAP